MDFSIKINVDDIEEAEARLVAVGTERHNLTNYLTNYGLSDSLIYTIEILWLLLMIAVVRNLQIITISVAFQMFISAIYLVFNYIQIVTCPN